MRKFIVILLIYTGSVYSQDAAPLAIGVGNPPIAHAQRNISFNYDTAGNQIQRNLVIVIPSDSGRIMSNQEDNKLDLNTEGDMLTYFPNPVKNTLNLRWSLIDGKNVKMIQIFSINGQLIKTYNTLESKIMAEIDFSGLPQGIFMLNILYSNSTQEVIKIIKD